MKLVGITVPEPNPERMNALMEAIRMLETGSQRKRYVNELVEILKPWAKHWAGGHDEAQRLIRRVKALASSSNGHLFAAEEITDRLEAAAMLVSIFKSPADQPKE